MSDVASPFGSGSDFRKISSTHPVSVALSFVVCSSLLYSSVVLAKPTLSDQGPSRSGRPSSTSGQVKRTGLLGSARDLVASLFTILQGGGPPSVPGSGLPDLDVARQTQPSEPVAPPPIVSAQACTDCTPCPTCGPGSANHAPVVGAGGPYYGITGTAVVFNGL